MPDQDLDLPYHAEKCPCGRNGRFRLYGGNGMKLCLGCMQYWLSEKLKQFKEL